jgi:hypothetical protein
VFVIVAFGVSTITIIIIRFSFLLSICCHNSNTANYTESTGILEKYTNNKQQTKTLRKEVIKITSKNIINNIIIVKIKLLREIICSLIY